MFFFFFFFMKKKVKILENWIFNLEKRKKLIFFLLSVKRMVLGIWRLYG